MFKDRLKKDRSDLEKSITFRTKYVGWGGDRSLFQVEHSNSLLSY